MDDARRKLLWVYAAIAAAMAPHLALLPAWVIVLLICCALVTLHAHLRGRATPHIAIRIVLVAAGVLGVLATYGTINGLDAGSSLLAVMLALKLLETRRPRDRVVLLFIAYFLILAAFLRSETLPLTLYLVAATGLATTALIQGARSGRVLPARRALAVGAHLLGSAVPIMIVLFLLFPRVPGPVWGNPTPERAVTGLSERMSPGDVSSLSLSDELVFRARFGNHLPEPSQMYWRALVLDFFDGRTWAPRRAARFAGQADEAELLIDERDAPLSYELIMEPHGRNWVYALELPAAPAGSGVYRSADLLLQTTQPVNQRRRLELGAHLQTQVGPAATSADLDPHLQLPPGSNPRSRALGLELRAATATPRETVDALLQRFRRQTYYYTLEPPPLGADPVDEFLFETRRGFCEHYASAFAMVMRAAGIPARVVLGYQGGELNPLSGYHLVRQYDAHAWTEVWLEDEGWVRVDPVAAVAPERVSLGLFGALRQDDAFHARALRAPRWMQGGLLAWDATNTWWQSRVVGYDQGSQRRLLAQLGMDSAEQAARAGVIAVIAAALLALLSTVPGLRWRERRTRPDPLLAAWQRACRRLAAAGLARAPWEGPIEFAQRVAAARPELGERFAPLAMRFARLRYEPAASEVQAQELIRRLRRLRP